MTSSLVTGHSIPLYLFGQRNNLLLIDFVYILLFSFHFCLLYLHSILYTKNFCFSIYILGWHVYQILLMNFFLLNIPLFVILNILVGFLQACGYDLDIVLLLLFLFLFLNIIREVYCLCLFSIACILLVFYILVQKLCGIFIFTWYVINYSCPSFNLLV